MYKVFLVDDEPFIVEGLYAIVDWSHFGLEIVGQAEDGRQALEALSQVPVDILITDIRMPNMDGLTLIRRAKELNEEMKVIVLSGYDDFDYLKEGMVLGIENYLLKPINIEELKKTLRSTVEKLDTSIADTVYGRENMDIIRDNILYRWLTNAIDGEELKMRLCMLGVQLDGPYYLVAVIEVIPYEEGETSFAQGFSDVPSPAVREQLYLTYDIVRNKVQERCQTVCFRDKAGQTVVIFSLENRRAAKVEATEWLHALYEDLQGAVCCEVVIGIGGDVSGKALAAKSYADAQLAAQYYLIEPKTHVLEIEQLSPVALSRTPAFQLDLPAYAATLLARDRQALFQLIDADFARLQGQSGVTPAHLQTAAIDIIVHIQQSLNNVCKGSRTQASTLTVYRHMFARVFQAPSIDALKTYVKVVAKTAMDSLTPQDEVTPIVQQVLRHIDAHYAEGLSLKMLGQTYNVHPVYLGQLFQKETNESFSHYVNRYRIEKSKQLLRETHLKTREIARKVGFWDASYFYRQFKRYVGVSPTEFRNLP
ncbi:response regulator transcription factor [Numidum massiliense]|uniref:response regulator transcription factor n=1 Tax=Numidum massiliense TaxID=1522315 RepID=UPI00093FB241|nr:response regulator transcription factor [Numidum massiliense]